MSREVAVEGVDVSANGAKAAGVVGAGRAFAVDAGDNVEHCPEVEDSVGVDENEICHGEGGTDDVSVRDG
jgi:hypothetical protein